MLLAIAFSVGAACVILLHGRERGPASKPVLSAEITPRRSSAPIVSSQTEAPKSPSKGAILHDSSPRVANPTAFKRTHQSPSVNQDGIGNQQQVATGVTQIVHGDCTQNIVNGNNNNQYCKPKVIEIGTKQEQQIKASLSEAGPLQGEVTIGYQDNAYYAPALAESLKEILQSKGIVVDIQHAMLFSDEGRSPIPGLAFSNVTPANQQLAERIGLALQKSHVLTAPPTGRLGGNNKFLGDKLGIILMPQE